MMNPEIKTVKKGDPAYPARLLPYAGMPGTLYYCGTLPDDGPAAAIVGARGCSAYGRAQRFHWLLISPAGECA